MRRLMRKGEPMTERSAVHQIEAPKPGRPAPLREAARPLTTDELVQQLLKANNSNELAKVIGLMPIKGLSGPNLFY